MVDFLGEFSKDVDFLSLMKLLTPWIMKILSAVAVMLIGIIVGSSVFRQIFKMSKKSSRDATFVQYLGVLVKYAIYILTGIIALGMIGIPTASLIAILASSGLALGIGLRTHISSLASGLLLQITRSVRLHDWIKIGSYEGKVQKLDLFTTTLQTESHSKVVIPNNKLATDILENKGKRN